MSHNRIKDDVWTGCVNERGYWINNDQRTKADHFFFLLILLLYSSITSLQIW